MDEQLNETTPTDVDGLAGGGQGTPAPADDGQTPDNDTQGIGQPDPAPENEWLGAPDESYGSDGIELPDGFELTDETANALAGVCKDMGLSQRAFANIVNKMTPVLAAQEQARIDEFKKANLRAFANDPRLGGRNAQATLAAARQAYQRFCPESVRQMFNAVGFDTHKDVISMFYDLSQLVSNDTSPRSGGAAVRGFDARSFFNNSNMEG